jgi:hypothetical protein
MRIILSVLLYCMTLKMHGFKLNPPTPSLTREWRAMQVRRSIEHPSHYPAHQLCAMVQHRSRQPSCTRKHTLPTTTALGLFNVNIGTGTPSTGTISAVNWGNGAKVHTGRTGPHWCGTSLHRYGHYPTHERSLRPLCRQEQLTFLQAQPPATPSGGTVQHGSQTMQCITTEPMWV